MSRDRAWHLIGWLALSCLVLLNVAPGLFGIH